MRNHQCSCGYGELYRISPSSFPSSLSIRFLRFPQVFSELFRLCSDFDTFCLKKAQQNRYFPASHFHSTELVLEKIDHPPTAPNRSTEYFCSSARVRFSHPL